MFLCFWRHLTVKRLLHLDFFLVQQPLFIGAPGLARGGDDGRLVGEPVADVDIERVAVAAELPVGRHVELVKCDGVAVQE